MISKASLRSILLTSVFLLCLFACNRDEEVNTKPAIAFSGVSAIKDTANKDSLLVIGFSYKDGDGDLGYGENAVDYPFALGDPYFFNLFCEIYAVDANGLETNITDMAGDTINFHQRLTSITPEGKNKAIDGEMRLTIDFILLKINGLSPDRVKFKIWLIDRALQKSNEIETGVIDINI